MAVVLATTVIAAPALKWSLERGEKKPEDS
jgi:hypothetical protein